MHDCTIGTTAQRHLTFEETKIATSSQMWTGCEKNEIAAKIILLLFEALSQVPSHIKI
jgi:hypothetical protein